MGSITNFIEIPKDPCKTHPLRQSGVIENVRKAINGVTVNQYDIQCINKVYNINKRPEFYYCGSIKNSTPQYSYAFVSWILKEQEKDVDFFKKVRQAVKNKS